MIPSDKPILYIIIPCYNEQEVLPQTAPMFLDKLTQLTQQGKIAENSRILFVNDGSKDKTWEIICDLATARASGSHRAVLALALGAV